jgi:glycosyltransferase involved in cell wall biosynthesis
MKFSICIPNYNYAHYLDKTIQSVLSQSHDDLEIVMADNASTDNSVAVAQGFGDPRLQVRVNECNVGFAGNLDRAASMASGERMILLSSDDLMEPGALATYEKLAQLVPDGGKRAIFASAQYMIDSDGVKTARMGVLPPPFLLESERDGQLEKQMGAPVYRVNSKALLKRCVLRMQNPFHFATACYPRALYQAVGGYGGGRTYNPDKWFHWRLLAAADEAYYVDLPLFSYRWHASNQMALEKRSGVLRFLVDEYLNSFELPNTTLEAIGLKREEVEQAFVEREIGQHGLAVLARTDAREARRILRFGQAVYPHHVRANRKAWLLRLVLPFGPLAHQAARWAYARRRERVVSPVEPIPAGSMPRQEVSVG